MYSPCAAAWPAGSELSNPSTGALNSRPAAPGGDVPAPTLLSACPAVAGSAHCSRPVAPASAEACGAGAPTWMQQACARRSLSRKAGRGWKAGGMTTARGAWRSRCIWLSPTRVEARSVQLVIRERTSLRLAPSSSDAVGGRPSGAAASESPCSKRSRKTMRGDQGELPMARAATSGAGLWSSR
eukprot:scaffold4908_cov109-Isochrysis_galbana.AAC.8